MNTQSTTILQLLFFKSIQPLEVKREGCYLVDLEGRADSFIERYPIMTMSITFAEAVHFIPKGSQIN